MNLTTHQLKKSLIPIGVQTKEWKSTLDSCTFTASLYDILSSYYSSTGFNIITDSTLQGNGNASSPLGLASQNASTGQVLTFNGTKWVPSSPAFTSQTLAFTSPFLTISGGNTVDLSPLIDVNQILSVAGFELTISSGNTVTLPNSWQTLTIEGNTLTIGPNGNAVNLATLSGGYDTIQSASSSLSPRSKLNFVNSPTFVLTDDALNDTTNVALAANLVQLSLISPTSGAILYYNGTSWAQALPIKNVQTGMTGTMVNLPSVPISNLPTDVYLNGVLKEEAQDYTISSNTINFTFNLNTSDKITTKYFN